MAFQIGKNCQIDPTAVINVKNGFIGDNSIVRAHARIEGSNVEIGREAFIDIGAVIGGGSCFDAEAFLKAGDWLHMGMNSHINTARGVTIGHEFGCGIETKIFTHGVYLDSYNLGAPAQWGPVVIGDNVWMPNAWVNPGVRVGSQVVVAARSLVNQDLPSGCLAGGTPAQIIKDDYLPKKLSDLQKKNLLQEIVRVAWRRHCLENSIAAKGPCPVLVEVDHIYINESGRKTEFQVLKKQIFGSATDLSLVVKDQLRRNGIRFRYEATDGYWHAWQEASRSENIFV